MRTQVISERDESLGKQCCSLIDDAIGWLDLSRLRSVDEFPLMNRDQVINYWMTIHTISCACVDSLTLEGDWFDHPTRESFKAVNVVAIQTDSAIARLHCIGITNLREDILLTVACDSLVGGGGGGKTGRFGGSLCHACILATTEVLSRGFDDSWKILFKKENTWCYSGVSGAYSGYLWALVMHRSRFLREALGSILLELFPIGCCESATASISRQYPQWGIPRSMSRESFRHDSWWFPRTRLHQTRRSRLCAAKLRWCVRWVVQNSCFRSCLSWWYSRETEGVVNRFGGIVEDLLLFVLLTSAHCAQTVLVVQIDCTLDLSDLFLHSLDHLAEFDNPPVWLITVICAWKQRSESAWTSSTQCSICGWVWVDEGILDDEFFWCLCTSHGGILGRLKVLSIGLVESQQIFFYLFC